MLIQWIKSYSVTINFFIRKLLLHSISEILDHGFILTYYLKILHHLFIVGIIFTFIIENLILNHFV